MLNIDAQDFDWIKVVTKRREAAEAAATPGADLMSDFVDYVEKNDPELALVLKGGLRRVQTLEGVRRYKLPLGSIIGRTPKPMTAGFSPDNAPQKAAERLYRAVDGGLWEDRKRMLLDPQGGASVHYMTAMPPDASQGGAMCSRDSARTRVFPAQAWKTDGRRILQRFIDDNADYWEEGDVYIGAWVTSDKTPDGEEHRLIWLDPSRFFKTDAEAATYGAAIGEREIFSLSDFTSRKVEVVEGAVVKGLGTRVDLFIADPNDKLFSVHDLYTAITNAVESNSSISKAVRRVRTPAGAKKYGQPIGSIILRDGQKPIAWLKAAAQGVDDYGIEHFDGADGKQYGIVQAGDMEDWSDLPRGTEDSDYIALWFPNGRGDIADYEVLNEERIKGEYSAITFLNADVGEQVRDKGMDDVRTVPQGYRRLTPKERKSVKEGGGITHLPHTNAKGQRVPLAVPPMWNNVVVATDPNADVWVYGIDSIGREQTVRNPGSTAKAAQKKYAHAKRVAKNHVGQLDSAVSRDWQANENAAVVMLMLRYGMRIGGEGGETVKDHTALGARTIQAKNVRVNKDSVTLEFVGKSAQNIKLVIKDPETVAMLKRYKEGKRGNDRLFPSASLSGVAGYLKTQTDGTVKPKDLRTVKGTALALEAISKVGPRKKPKTKSEYVRLRNDIADQVAAALGNTRTMALSSYISPEVWVKLTTPDHTDWLGPKGF